MRSRERGEYDTNVAQQQQQLLLHERWQIRFEFNFDLFDLFHNIIPPNIDLRSAIARGTSG